MKQDINFPKLIDEVKENFKIQFLYRNGLSDRIKTRREFIRDFKRDFWLVLTNKLGTIQSAQNSKTIQEELTIRQLADALSVIGNKYLMSDDGSLFFNIGGTIFKASIDERDPDVEHVVIEPEQHYNLLPSTVFHTFKVNELLEILECYANVNVPEIVDELTYDIEQSIKSFEIMKTHMESVLKGKNIQGLDYNLSSSAYGVGFGFGITSYKRRFFRVWIANINEFNRIAEHILDLMTDRKLRKEFGVKLVRCSEDNFLGR